MDAELIEKLRQVTRGAHYLAIVVRQGVMRFICWVLGHHYFVIRRYSPEERQVGCYRCGARWGMHDGVKSFIPWDGELERLYEGDWRFRG